MVFTSCPGLPGPDHPLIQAGYQGGDVGKNGREIFQQIAYTIWRRFTPDVMTPIGAVAVPQLATVATTATVTTTATMAHTHHFLYQGTLGDFSPVLTVASAPDSAFSPTAGLPAEIPRVFPGAETVFSTPAFDDELPIPVLPAEKPFICLLSASAAITGATDTARMNRTATIRDGFEINRCVFIVQLLSYLFTHALHGRVSAVLARSFWPDYLRDMLGNIKGSKLERI
jgi:hypothetical protein